jgi:predicted short-subunit dehydrogenase-like oxidoreductase (DUF2520 family)
MNRAPLNKGRAHTRSAGLISAGGMAQSFLVRLPSLLESIGPVKGTSYRVARRISNTLRAGHAVEHYSEFEECRLIWLDVPDTVVDQVTREFMSQAQVSGKMVVLCGSSFDSSRLSPLRAAGAHVASLNEMDPVAPTLIAEGDPGVLRELRRLAATEKRKLIEIIPASKCLYLAGVHLSGHLVLPWIAAALESFRAAGFSRAEAVKAVGRLNSRSVRAYEKAGRKAWNAGAASELRRSLERDLDSIRARDPRLAALYSTGVDLALKCFETR